MKTMNSKQRIRIKYGIHTYLLMMNDRTAGPIAGAGLEPCKVKKTTPIVGAGPQPCKVEANKSKQQATNQ
jgi:hypothetical protein